MSLLHGCASLPQRFRLALAPFLQSTGLPFSDVLNERDIEEAANAEGVDFGYGPDDIWTPALTLWAFLSQVLHTGSSRSCAAAVSRAIVLLTTLGREPCSDDTGEYCRARAKLPESLLKRLTTQVADELEDRVPGDWLWQGRHVKLVDGTTMEMPDTPANQASFPQNPTQAPGLGFPIARTVVLVSLASAAICGLALGPYQGKESGETALFRQLFDQLDEGDVVLADRYYCSYLMIALLSSHGVDTVARRHQCRKSTRGQRLGKGDRLVEWQRPACPDWMDESTYATIPKTLVVREVEVNVEQPGFRTKQFVVVTTLTDPKRYPKDRIAELYHQRWQAELDIRAIKRSMEIEPLRCKSPEMVRKEIWMLCVGYNLVRKTIAQAALVHERSPREIGFTGAMQVIASSWDTLSFGVGTHQATLVRVQLRSIASHKVGNRPNRFEPREVKRRPRALKFMTQPRDEARAEMLSS